MRPGSDLARTVCGPATRMGRGGGGLPLRSGSARAPTPKGVHSDRPLGLWGRRGGGGEEYVGWGFRGCVRVRRFPTHHHPSPPHLL